MNGNRSARVCARGHRYPGSNLSECEWAPIASFLPEPTVGVASLIGIVHDETDNRLPRAARFALSEIADQIEGLNRKIGKLEHAIVMDVKRDDDMRRL